MKIKRDKFRIGAEKDGKLIGVVQVARPVARGNDYANCGVVPIDAWDWAHDKSLTAIPGQLGGYEPTVNGKCHYRRILVRLRPEWLEKQRRRAEALTISEETNRNE